MREHNKKLVIIDGNAILHRAFHALPPLATKSGKMVNAVYGFALIFLKMLKELKPDYFILTFDTAAPTFRHKEFAEYKAKRIKQPQELYDQIPLIKEFVKAFRVPIYEKDGFEADDVIGTLAASAEKDKDLESMIVTGDLDTLQLIDNQTKVYTLKKGITDTIIYDEKAVKQRYGLTPGQMIDFKALRGDPSDNIPGVRGIGEKTALGLMHEFGSLEKLYEELEKNTPRARKIKERIRNLLIDQKEGAFLSKKLVTIVCDVPIKLDLEKAKVSEIDKKRLVQLLQEWDFRSLLSRIPGMEDAPPESKKKPNKQDNRGYHLIDTEEKLGEFLEELKKQKEFTFDTETTGLDPLTVKLLGVSFCWKEGEAYFLSTRKNLDFLKELKPIFEDAEIKKNGHHLKFDIRILQEQGIETKGLEFDTMVASYLLSPGSRAHNLDAVVFSELGHQMISIQSLTGETIKKKIAPALELVPLDKLSEYACEDADYTFRLITKLSHKLEKNNLYRLFEEIEMPLIEVLADMERSGAKIDVGFLKKLSQKVEKMRERIDKEIIKLAGMDFNIDSPLQLKEVLFEKLKISPEGLARTKTGISTAASELEKLRGRHKIIDLISEHRELAKLNNTYLEALPELVNPKTGRVHTSYNQTITATGRLSSSDPNLQNIPVRTDLGKEVRKAFIAEKGYKILAADYSQIELRIVSHLANDEKMQEAFNKGEDIHKCTAAEIWGVPLDKVDKEMRYHAKTINFGILYGMGSGGLARATGLDKNKAREFIEKYFEIHSGIKDYVEETIALARELGYVETLLGRRRYLPEITAGHQMMRAQAERMAVNHPVQGTCADLIKMAMIKIYKELDPKDAKMILQAHDELVFEVKEDAVKKTAKLVDDIMETIIKLRVPLKTDISIGDNWGELSEL